MSDDEALEDPRLMDEIELLAAAIVAAADATEHLTPEQIDDTLGVTPGPKNERV